MKAIFQKKKIIDNSDYRTLQMLFPYNLNVRGR